VLRVHRAERADGLVAALGALLAVPQGDPFAPELIAVPTRGMERWLTQRLSAYLGAGAGGGDGICANVDFPFPRRLVGDAVAVASGIAPDSDPWLPERLLWPLLATVEACLDEPWLRPLAAHLGHGAEPPDPTRRTRRLGAVQHLAELFDRYGLHRPELVVAWAAGRDVAADDHWRAETNGGAAARAEAGEPSGGAAAAAATGERSGGTPPDGDWQAELWRRLRARIGVPSPAERLAGACARLRADADAIALPPRLALFGLTRLPAGHLEVLRALAARHDVHLFLLHPSPALWARLATAPPVRRRADDASAALAANPLLASWGRDARESQLVLGAGVESEHHDVAFADGTLLARIQADVRANRPPPGAPLPGAAEARAPLAAGDRSLQIHACHGRARQVEVARDAILHLLADDPTLEPRDVIVMCPDIETFAPLIEATFGAGALDGEPPAADAPVDLRVRLADRALRQTNPLLGVVAELLELAEQRLTASQVLDLADREPLRRRFRFDDDDLTRLREWVAEAGIRWGLDAEQRAPFGLADLPSGTWRAGLDRLLLGVTMSEDGQPRFAGVLPFDDVESGAIDLAGRFAELVARLAEAVDRLAVEQPIAAWAAALADAADALTATGPREGWQRGELQRLLDDVVGEAAGDTTPLAPAELRALLAGRLRGRPTRASFRTGHLTICTLVPMRSVPHRVVCLLGLDDGVFPRRAPRDGDDLLLDDPHVGERDPRGEDRQLLLDALLAASERLIVTYAGNDERTNVERPPAVPVGELLDVVEATASGDARERVLIRHPLQPFDPRNFTPGALVPARAWSFDAVTLRGARALRGPRAAPAPFLSGPLAPLPASFVELDDLVRFVEHPVRAFLRQRLRIDLRGQEEDELEDALRVELAPLQRWAIGQRLLEARLAGVDGRAAVLAEIARGSLPPGTLGQPVIAELYPIVDAIVAAARAVEGAARGGAAAPGEPPRAGDAAARAVEGATRGGAATPGGTPRRAGDAAARGGTSAHGDAAPELWAAATRAVDVRLALPDGRALTGTVAGLSGELLLATTFARVSPRHRLAAWVRLLALTAARPDACVGAATIGRGGGESVAVARIAPPAPAAALAQLAALVDLYDRGMREPVPLYGATSAAWAAAAGAGEDPVAAARVAWTSAYRHRGEDDEREHALVLGGPRPFAELLAEPPRRDEAWAGAEPTRLGAYARRLWDGLLAHETVTAR